MLWTLPILTKMKIYKNLNNDYMIKLLENLKSPPIVYETVFLS